jgi:squalene monooxygenase
LQPGGVKALTLLGMQDTLKGIDAIRVDGYYVIRNGEEVIIPYPEKEFKTGWSFHHGKFIQSLRKKLDTPNITKIQGTASELIKDELTSRYIGIKVNTNTGKQIVI